jgi:TnpA family transposase
MLNKEEIEFINKFNISEKDLNSRLYSVDCIIPITLFELIKINKQSVMAESLSKLDEYIPIKEILSLNINETYIPFGAIGADIKRIA